MMKLLKNKIMAMKDSNESQKTILKLRHTIQQYPLQTNTKQVLPL